jgi:hypothetical protein
MGQWMSSLSLISCKEDEKRCRRYRVRIKSPRSHRRIPQNHCTAGPLEQVAVFPSAAYADNGTHRRADTGPAHTALGVVGSKVTQKQTINNNDC